MKPVTHVTKFKEKFMNQYMNNQVVLDLKRKEKEQYDNLKVRLLDNKIHLNN